MVTTESPKQRIFTKFMFDLQKKNPLSIRLRGWDCSVGNCPAAGSTRKTGLFGYTLNRGQLQSNLFSSEQTGRFILMLFFFNFIFKFSWSDYRNHRNPEGNYASVTKQICHKSFYKRTAGLETKLGNCSYSSFICFGNSTLLLPCSISNWHSDTSDN